MLLFQPDFIRFPADVWLCVATEHASEVRTSTDHLHLGASTVTLGELRTRRISIWDSFRAITESELLGGDMKPTLASMRRSCGVGG